jgi:hypothetical protein
MAGKKRCFSSVRALKKLDERLLCGVLGKFPQYLHSRGIELPDPPGRSRIDYEAIRDACMAGDIPTELDDVLFLVSILGTKKGQAQIEQQARFDKRKLKINLEGVSNPDFAMKVWLHDWPSNKDLLEASYARGRIFSKSSYVYSPMFRDVRKHYRRPTKALLDDATAELEEYFANQERLGRGTRILVYDFPNEICFLVRYPGQIERHEAVDEEGDSCRQVFRPEEYDNIIYHKIYGDLRMNTNRQRDHARYRIIFGQLLFGRSSVFDPTIKLINLDPIIGETLDIFNCEDVDGLAEIHPIEISFSQVSQNGKRIIWKSDNDVSLRNHPARRNHLLPDDAHSVLYAKFRYRLSDHSKWERITVHHGRSLTYERDGDSAVIERWLRQRGFVKNPIDGAAL